MTSAAAVDVVRGLRLAECKDCHEPIRFVQLDGGGVMPVDPMPNAAGNVCAIRVLNRLHGFVIKRDRPADPTRWRFMPHHATCEERRRKAPPAAPPPDPEPTLF